MDFRIINSVHCRKWRLSEMDSEGINQKYAVLMRKKTLKKNVLSASQSDWNQPGI